MIGVAFAAVFALLLCVAVFLVVRHMISDSHR